MSPPRSDPCDRCRSLLERPADSFVMGHQHSENDSHVDLHMSEVHEAASQGCPICGLCWEHLLALPHGEVLAETPLILQLIRQVPRHLAVNTIDFPAEYFGHTNDTLWFSG